MKSHQKIVLDWDTSVNITEFPEPLKVTFNQFYFSERNKFVKWLDKISINFSSDLDWWVSPPASRNLYYSDIYKYICILKTIDKLKNKFEFIIETESSAFKKILKKLSYSNVVSIQIKKNKRFILRNFFYLYIIKNIFIFCTQYFMVKIFYKRREIQKDTTLIDTFIIDKKNKEKYYYGNLLDHAKKKNRNITFLTTIIENNLFKFLGILISLRNDKNYLLKENYLNLIDIINCLLYSFRIKKFNKNFKKFENLEISELIKEEVFYNRNLFSVYLGISNFYFFKNLRTKSIKIKKVINWFENQPKDKGLNYGVRKFFPKTLSFGYQGFTDYPEYMNTYPSISEFKSKVIPSQIIVCGDRYKEARKEFCKKLKVINGPALRAQQIFKNIKKKDKYKIVIFLEGASKIMDRNMIIKFIKISKNFKNLKFFIKTHPILSLKKLNIDIPKNFEVINGSFSSIAHHTFISVSYGNTSATLESLAYGCNLIVPYDNYFDKKNLLKFGINKSFFRVCANDFDIINAIRFFLNKKNPKRHKNRDNIKNILFNKVNEKNISVLL